MLTATIPDIAPTKKQIKVSIKNPLNTICSPPIKVKIKYETTANKIPDKAPFITPLPPLIVKKHPINTEIIFKKITTFFTIEDDRPETFIIKAKANTPISATIKEAKTLLITDGKNFSFIFDRIKNPLLITIDMQGEFV